MELTKIDNFTSLFLCKLFARLNKEMITYCVLRNYKTLPEAIGNDIDIWVKDGHRKRLYEIVKDLAKILDYTLEYTPRLTLIGEGDYFLIKDSDKNINIIHLDCWTHIHWKGISFIDNLVLEKNMIWHKNLFPIPSPGIRASIMLLKDLLQQSKIKEKYKDIIKEYSDADREMFLKSILRAFGKNTALAILSMSINGTWIELERKTNKIRFILFLRAICHPIKQAINWIYYLRAQFRRFFVNSRGIFLVFIGPDGSGKSTTFHNLKKSEIKRLFQKIYYFHGHFAFMPELKRIVALFKSNCSEYQSSENSRSSKPLGMLRSIIYPLYYGINYFLGHLFIWKEKARGNLIVFDRYFYDYFIQYQYINCPRWILNTIAKIVPKPDVIIYLKNKPEVIFNRKNELNIEEIRRQGKICERLVRSFNNSYVIETSSINKVVEKVQRIIINKIKEKR